MTIPCIRLVIDTIYSALRPKTIKIIRYNRYAVHVGKITEWPFKNREMLHFNNS